MNIGGGFRGPMSKSYSKRTSHKHAPFFYAAVLILSGLALVLAGCGDISLNQLLENQEPGELSISPTDAYVPLSGTLEISGKGGFKPYTYQNIGTLGSIIPNTGEYTAPFSLGVSYDTTEIEVSDSFGTKASMTVTVFRPITLRPGTKTIREGDTLQFTATGGVPDPIDGYYFSVNDSDPESDLDGQDWEYNFPTEGTYTVEVKDSLGNSAVSMITVEGGMAIDAERNWVVKGTGPDSTTLLTAINHTSPHVFSTDPLGTPAEMGWLEVDSYNPVFPYTYDETAIYHAPDSERIVTIKLVDHDGNIATIDIHVLGEPPEALSLNPTVMTVVTNAENVQLSATGGIPDHHFSLVGPGYLSPHPTQEFRIRYNAPGYPTTAYVYVEDALGRQAKATIYVVEGD